MVRDWGWSGGKGGLEDMSLVASKAMAEVLKKEAGEEGDGKGKGSEGGCELYNVKSHTTRGGRE